MIWDVRNNGYTHTIQEHEIIDADWSYNANCIIVSTKNDHIKIYGIDKKIITLPSIKIKNEKAVFLQEKIIGIRHLKTGQEPKKLYVCSFNSLGNDSLEVALHKINTLVNF